MSEKIQKNYHSSDGKPTPMKLFALWEVEKSSPTCIARQCTLKLSHINVVKAVNNEVGPILIAVKMQNAKRTLRSNEVPVSSSGLLNTELDLTFSLQYPHFLKGDGNTLQIMIQRRKRYKNRTILGFKTLAVGVVNMSAVVQCSIGKELKLYSDPKECHNLAVVLTMESIVSQPVEQDEVAVAKGFEAPYRFDSEYEEDFSTNDEGSDSEPVMDTSSKPATAKLAGTALRQRNLKQKFMTLLKRFKVSEDLHGLGHDPDIDPKLAGEVGQLNDLLEELDQFNSDSEPEIDTVSINSIPKPSLPPFFASSQSLCDKKSQPKGDV